MARSPKPTPTVVSMTRFVDFVITTGSPRFTLVRNTKKQLNEEYSRMRDYYGVLRDVICTVHKSQSPKSALDKALVGVSEGRLSNYKPQVAAYKKWWGRKTIVWVARPPKKTWGQGNLIVRVNPELGVEINGTLHYVKLYFKAKKLTVTRLRSIHAMMEQAYSKDSKKPHLAVLDVRNGKLHVSKGQPSSALILLQGELAALQTMWQAI